MTAQRRDQLAETLAYHERGQYAEAKRLRREYCIGFDEWVAFVAAWSEQRKTEAAAA